MDLGKDGLTDSTGGVANIPTILVPLDGSKFAECALPFAIELAQQLTAAIELVCVSARGGSSWQRSGETISVEVPDDIGRGPSDYLDQTAKRIEAASSTRVLCTELFGSAAEEVVKHSKVHPPELIVLSTHGRGPMSRLWLGNVADRVIRHASMPVLLVRPKDGVDIDLTDRGHFGHILVALDGSPQSEASLHWAKRLGGVDTTYSLVRVEPVAVPAWTADPECAPFYLRDYTRNGHEDAAEYLRGVERRAMNGTKHVASVVMEGVPAAAGILRAADQKAADLITITTHGRGGLPNLILGSVADKVVRASGIPVLLVRRQAAKNHLLGDPEPCSGEEARSPNAEAPEAASRRELRIRRRQSGQLSTALVDRTRVL